VTPGDVAALLAQGQREEALAAAAREVNENPQDAGWRVVLGAVLVEMQQLAEGEKVLLDALRMAPDSPEALFNLSVALRRQGRTEEQVEALARIHPTWPGAGRVHADLSQAGLMLLMSGRHEAAVRAYRALLALQPGARPALYNMALALFAGLYRRRVTGQGCWIDSSQVETGTYLNGTSILDFSANGRGWFRYRDCDRGRPVASH